jgi:uncharacterized protein (TIGR02145 family)
MSKSIICLLFIACWALPALQSSAQSAGVAINPTGIAADPSAMLDVSSNSKGMLIPRLTTAQRNAIAAPAEGLLIFNSTTKCFEAFVNNAWNTVSCPGACPPPSAPTAGTHSPSSTQIIWNWNTVSGATGYQWNTTNIYLGSGVNVVTSPTYTQTGLNCNTPYNLYVWAYNSCGNSAVLILTQTTSACSWSCGSPVTDARDGQSYNTVQIGTQCWMRQNLAYLDTVVPPANYSSSVPYKYVYGYSGTDVVAAKATANYATYGVMYNWPAMLNGFTPCNGSGAPPNDQCLTPIQGICPAGWHIPSHYEWTTLEKSVGSNPGAFPYDVTTTLIWLGTDEGGNLKEAGTSHWTSPNTGATNSSGFTALPGGYTWSGSSSGIGNFSRWWSSTEQGSLEAWYRDLDYNYSGVYRDAFGSSKLYAGNYCRCIKD